MAQTNQEISLRLTVESAGFNEKLLKARKALYAIEAAGIKAAGGQKKYAAAVRRARMALKRANASYRGATTALQLHEIQAHKTANAVNRTTKASKKQNMAFTQAAYAIDDMQYGFQGVQNNLQAIAVSMGASGALVIGLTLLTVGIGMLIKKFQKAQKEAKKLKDELSEKQGLVASMMIAAEVVKDTAEGTDEHTRAMKELAKNGYDKATMSVDGYIAKLQEQMFLEAKLAASQKFIQDNLVAQLEAQDEIKKLEKAGPKKRSSSAGSGVMGGGAQLNQNDLDFAHKTKLDNEKETLKKLKDQLAEKLKITTEDRKQLEALRVKGKLKTGGDGDDSDDDKRKPMSREQMADNYYKSMNKDVKEHLELMNAQRATKEELISKELEMMEAYDLGRLNLDDQESVLHKIKVLKTELANIPGLGDNMVGVDNATIAMEKFKEQLAAIKLMLDEGIISWDEYLKRLDNATQSYNKTSESTKSVIDVGGMLQGQLSGLISGFAEAAGSGESMGNALLKGLGNMLVQLGGLIIAAGVAALNFTIMLLNPATAPLAIAAGAALVAAGAAVSSFANKAGGGGGGSSAGRASSGSSSTVINNPVRENARVRNSNLIIPMDMMRYGMQNAEDNYSGFN